MCLYSPPNLLAPSDCGRHFAVFTFLQISQGNEGIQFLAPRLNVIFTSECRFRCVASLGRCVRFPACLPIFLYA
jgi:hypothetical protein